MVNTYNECQILKSYRSLKEIVQLKFRITILQLRVESTYLNPNEKEIHSTNYTLQFYIVGAFQSGNDLNSCSFMGRFFHQLMMLRRRYIMTALYRNPPHFLLFFL
jgi:hypothetical protein